MELQVEAVGVLGMELQVEAVGVLGMELLVELEAMSVKVLARA
jgi:hypothetical protein